jgi:16S rRNA (cytosine1402-N4)-methyltransferase
MLGKLDGVLLDLGVSSPQLEDPLRGFSFGTDGPLDMRMDVSCGVTAADWLNSASEWEIADCLWRYGEERHSRRIAKRIVEARRDRPIGTTRQLVEIVSRALPYRRGRIHPATRVFQAVRIHVNQELTELATVMAQACAALAIGGRVAVIAFHSLEDRLVKRFFRGLARDAGDANGGSRFNLITRKPLRPSAAEIDANPRARSARLRVVERSA